MPSHERAIEQQTFLKALPPDLDPAKKEFLGCTFKSCDLSGRVLSRSVFIDCTFIDCNLSNIKVNGCGFRNVTFQGSKLVGVIFSGVNHLLLSWTFKECKIELCDFSAVKMKHSRFLECLVHKNDFVNTDLTEADFTGSDLSGSKFQHTILEKADFTQACHYYIDPSTNRMKQARFSSPEVLALLLPFDIRIEG
ncbi:MAG: pentapeptide repeat-containing protein [Candidatus Omnitrophica bacterium]|nr:pentapeptide repeat-containing protein [Candidatus Omnitrophota bacterium]